MLLRASSEQVGAEVDLGATVGRGTAGGGIPHGAELVAFAEAVTRGSDDADATRRALLGAVGPEAFLLAAGIVGVFNGRGLLPKQSCAFLARRVSTSPRR